MLDYQFLERVSRKTLLGIRFWDPALDTQVEDGLHVTLFPLENTRQVNQAYKTKSGVYAFNSISGMNDFEISVTDTLLTSPYETNTYVLRVQDKHRQFTPVALLVDLPLPYSGLFLVDDNRGSPSRLLKGFNLYSSINRSAVTQYTFVRGDLINRLTQQAAPHAVVRVTTEDDSSWFGISDENGRFAVMLPYPLLSVALGSSPSSGDGIQLFDRTWNIDISVMYDPMSVDVINGIDQPDYSSILSQNQAFIYTQSPETDVGEVNNLNTELVYGRDLVVKTAGFSELYVSPTGSPA